MTEIKRGTMLNRSSFALLHPLRVRWNECDLHGIVFNVNYLTYYDIAMYEWQRVVSRSKSEQPDFLTAHAECDFFASAHFDEELEIGARCIGIGTKSLDLEGAVFRGPELLNRGKLVYVHIKKETKEPVPLSRDFIERVIAFERVKPVSTFGLRDQGSRRPAEYSP
jgi:acyl-CoA thioester hydrolase